MRHGLSFLRKTCFLLFLCIFFAAGCQKFNWDGAAAAAKKDPKSGAEQTTPSNQVETPYYTPAAGAYNITQNVVIASATPGANICYTVDGSSPSCDSAAACTAGTPYAGTITVAASQTINSIACKATMVNSVQLSGAYTIDSVAPAISAVAPIAASVVTSTLVSYTLSENCGTGTITWTRTGGSADGASPHVKALVGAELASGAHTNITIANNPAVVANAVYDIAFDCTDPAGNVAATVTSTGVTIDNVPPVISATAPVNGAFVTNTQVSYTLSEACTTASITWTRTSGSGDVGSPHVQGLAGAELAAGVHSNITLTANPALVAGAVYTMDYNCTDAAGNSATTVTNTSVTYDNIAPVISAVAPATSAVVNSTTVSYTLSETCSTASITWTQTAGSADGGSPHVQALVGAELNAGGHPGITITNNPTLVSGAIYSIAFNCTDAAGNTATTVTSTNVTFDGIGPVISAVAPASSAGVNTTQVSYTLSEACSSASITWTWTSGAADGASPHVKALIAAEMTAGPHNNITISANPALVSGATYTVDFNCTDAAANAATPITVTNVYFDNVAPVISAVSPASSTVVNNQQVSYTLSENCASGTINWTYTGGTASGNFNQGLVAGELTSGSHNNFTISNNPVLVSGATYTITFNCTDPAGNVATAIARTNVTFDSTPPTVSLTNLLNNGPLNTGFVIGTASDNVTLVDVRVSFDGGPYNVATGTTAWKMPIPNGASTWPDRTTHTIDVRATDSATNQTNTTQITVRKGNNQDINGDGYPDLATGAWAYSTSTGRAYIYYGSNTGIISGSATAAPTILTRAATNNFFSRNIAMGDFNGDGFADLAVAAYGFTTNTGRVYIWNGGVAGITSGNATTAPLNITGAATNNNFGSNIIAGNANNDGYTDLVIGAVAYNASQGRAYIYYGGGGGIAGTTAAAANVTITGEAGTMQFGSALALGDFNNDNNPDLAITAPAYNTNWGRTYLFYGTAGVLNTVTAAPTDGIAIGESASSFYGGSIAAGDINGDGVTDLAVGAYGFTTNTGKIYIYNGVGGPGIATNNAATPTTTFTGEATNNYFTTSIAIADIHADGFADIIVGAYGYTTSTGRSYIFSGQAAALSSGAATLAGNIITGESINNNYGRGSGAFDINGDGRPDVINGANFYAGNQGRVYAFLSPIAGSFNASTATTILTGEAGTTEFGINISR